jgi:hypothetical protein
MKKLGILLSVLVLMTLLVSAFPSLSLASPPEEWRRCADLDLEFVTKFEWTGNGYQLCEDCPNPGPVDLGGDEFEGWWESEIAILAVILKGGPGDYVYDYQPDGAFSGEFDNSGLPGEPAISHVEFCGGPTSIVLVSFDAEVTIDGSVALAWETGTEVDNAGSNLYRATAEEGPYIQINDELIVAKGDAASGASYTFVDEPGHGTFYYRLEDVGTSGARTLRAMVEVLVARPIRPPLSRPRPPRR